MDTLVIMMCSGYYNHRSKNTPQGVWFCGVEEGEEKTNPAGHTYTVKLPNIYLEMVNFS
jgi:hypothetical protein